MGEKVHVISKSLHFLWNVYGFISEIRCKNIIECEKEKKNSYIYPYLLILLSLNLIFSLH